VKPLRAAAAERWHGVTRNWHVDFTDPLEMAGLRARVLSLSSVLGLLAGVSGMLASPPQTRTAWGVQIGISLYLVILIVWLRRRSRIGDREFLAIMFVSHGFAAVTTWLGEGAGDVARTVLSMLTVVLLAAVFCGTRRHVAIEVSFATVALILIGRFGPPRTLTGQDVSTGAFDVIVVSAVVRLLRDLAVSAVLRARQGEVTDPLTGLANRRGLEKDGAQRWASRAKEHTPIALLVIDVDHFKQVNDLQGHAAGDAILRRLAEVISSTIRADDVAVRLGGEEFLVLCSVPVGQAEAVAERLRATVERELGPVTVSIGVHEVLPDSADPLPTSIWSAVDIADRALYAAKNNGRNRVETSTR